jgi:hypothetical protein
MTALIVTLAGSTIPAAIKSQYLLLAAFHPYPN